MDIDQGGTGSNVATVLQAGSTNSWTLIRQASLTTAYAEQAGYDNTMSLLQLGGLNDADLYQEASSSNSLIDVKQKCRLGLRLCQSIRWQYEHGYGHSKFDGSYVLRHASRVE